MLSFIYTYSNKQSYNKWHFLLGKKSFQLYYYSYTRLNLYVLVQNYLLCKSKIGLFIKRHAILVLISSAAKYYNQVKHNQCHFSIIYTIITTLDEFVF